MERKARLFNRRGECLLTVTMGRGRGGWGGFRWVLDDNVSSLCVLSHQSDSAGDLANREIQPAGHGVEKSSYCVSTLSVVLDLSQARQKEG